MYVTDKITTCRLKASHSAAHLLQSCCAGMALSYRHYPSLLAGTLSPCVDPGWASSASFLFCWQTLSSPCKHLDYAASCILSCCYFYLEFTSLADSVVTKELHTFAGREVVRISAPPPVSLMTSAIAKTRKMARSEEHTSEL